MSEARPSWTLAHHYATPSLLITWPAAAGFSDVAQYAFDVLETKGSIAQRIVELVFGTDVLQQMLAAIGERFPPEELGLARRVWVTTDELERLTIDAAGMHHWTSDTGSEQLVSEVPDAFAPLRARIETYWLVLRAT